MHGNVWQWCLDDERVYDKHDKKDPKGNLNGLHRALRGGRGTHEREALSPTATLPTRARSKKLRLPRRPAAVREGPVTNSGSTPPRPESSSSLATGRPRRRVTADPPHPRNARMNSFVTNLESALDARASSRPVYKHAPRPAAVVLRPAAVRTLVTPEAVARRPPTLWRYRELLPLPARPAGDVGRADAALAVPRLVALGLRRLFVKDESQPAHRSFKSRGMTPRSAWPPPG